jgi:hypothetical protein
LVNLKSIFRKLINLHTIGGVSKHECGGLGGGGVEGFSWMMNMVPRFTFMDEMVKD